MRRSAPRRVLKNTLQINSLLVCFVLCLTVACDSEDGRRNRSGEDAGTGDGSATGGSAGQATGGSAGSSGNAGAGGAGGAGAGGAGGTGAVAGSAGTGGAAAGGAAAGGAAAGGAAGIGGSGGALTAQLCFSYSEPDFGAGPLEVQDRSTGGGSASVTVEPTGGNPGAYLRVVTSSAGAGNHAELLMLLPASEYVPSASGPIQSIVFKVDMRTFGGSVSQYHEPALEQGGTIYRIPSMGTFVSDFWGNVGPNASDASVWEDTNGAHPDFSATGGAIRFGVLRTAPDGSGTLTAGIDNFLLEVTCLR